ncbi:uncharacterized protein LOC135159755 [Diachasmimorpha longicaudata]|uniref:uncharacterized protein LOC135159755 n=1 Tax=Diachasmimorpha longicaudata TaxID=58733 RepID=UPI0030B8F3C3
MLLPTEKAQPAAIPRGQCEFVNTPDACVTSVLIVYVFINNMQNEKEFILSVTQRIFSNWSALEMAVAHGMGSKDSAIDFCPWITETLFMNENPSNKEVAEALEDYMESEFQTELEDGSAIQVAEQLLKFYRYCTEGNEAVAVTEMEKLPSLKTWILTREEIRQRGNNRTVPVNEQSHSDSEDNEAQMEVSTNDDWVEVRTKRKK